MKRHALILATLAAGTAAATASAGGALTQRLLAAGELRGYTPTHARVLKLNAYARVADLDPKAKDHLAHSGFSSAALETLDGPSLPPHVGPSQSSVLQFRTSARATDMLAWIKRTYGGATPKDIHSASFTVPGLARQWSTHYWTAGPKGRLDEYDATFAHGRYLYELDLFAGGGSLTRSQVSSAIAAYARRLSG